MAMPEPRLRRLGAGDLAALNALEARHQAHPWSRAQLATALSASDSAVFGGEVEGRLVAFAVLARLPFDGELQTLLVAPDWRRRGLAARLLEGLVRQARRWSCERLLLEVRAGNAAARALYGRAGFIEDGRRRGYYPPTASGAPREDAVLMSLTLDAAGAEPG